MTMVTITVLKQFRDLIEHVDRYPGDTFDVTDERAEQLSARLPGYATYAKQEQDSLSGLSIDELRTLAEERGIEVPKKVGKAKLIALLEA